MGLLLGKDPQFTGRPMEAYSDSKDAEISKKVSTEKKINQEAITSTIQPKENFISLKK